jgi:hypothetical protein
MSTQNAGYLIQSLHFLCIITIYVWDSVLMYMCQGDKFAFSSYTVLFLSPNTLSDILQMPRLKYFTVSLSLVVLESEDAAPEEYGLARKATLLLLSLHHW